MPFKDIQNSIDTWKEKLTPTVLSIFGGEPLLHPKLFDIYVSYTKKYIETKFSEMISKQQEYLKK